MKSFDLKGTARTEVGKKSTNELRKNNGIPCVLYGIEKEAQAFAVTTDAVRKLVYTPDIHLVNLTIKKELTKMGFTDNVVRTQLRFMV